LFLAFHFIFIVKNINLLLSFPFWVAFSHFELYWNKTRCADGDGRYREVKFYYIDLATVTVVLYQCECCVYSCVLINFLSSSQTVFFFLFRSFSSFIQKTQWKGKKMKMDNKTWDTCHQGCESFFFV
jgi:hypothetical protein